MTGRARPAGSTGAGLARFVPPASAQVPAGTAPISFLQGAQPLCWSSIRPCTDPDTAMRRQAAGVARPAKLVCYQQVHRAVSFQNEDSQHESPFSALLTPPHEEDTPSTPSSLLDPVAAWDEFQPPLASPLLPPGRAAASTGIGPWGPSLSRSQGYLPSSSTSSTAAGTRSLASSTVPLSAAQRDSQLRELEGMVSGFQALNLSLQLRNDELESDLESARSELPAKDLLYQQLQAQFFRLQRQYASSQAELAASREEAARLRGRLRAAEEALRIKHLAM